MWRRALLAAAAVLCTLLMHAHAQRSQRLTQIQDLICVLIMSGMQKEDLDVSMLRKLQRYNVNLDDIDNERIRQQCYTKNNDLTTKQREKNTEGSTTEFILPTTTNSLLPSVSLNMNTVLNYLKAHKESVRKLDEIITEETTATRQDIITPTSEHIETESKVDVELLRKYIQLETQKKSFYKRDNNSETIHHDTTINLKNNERSPSVVNDVALIDKLFKEYLFHKQEISTTTEFPTSRYTVDLLNVYKQIDEIIANTSIKNNENDKTISNFSKNDGLNMTHNTIKPIQVTPLNQTRSYHEGNLFIKSFYNYFSEMTQFKNASFGTFPTNNEDKDILLAAFNQNNKKPSKESTSYKSKPETENNHKTLTDNLVKEIAETVKEVIMKDLRKEMADIYLKTTQTVSTTIKTTTEISTTSKSYKTRIQEKGMSIMEKFSDLYEQIKSLKQATLVLKPKKEEEAVVSYLKQQSMTPANREIFISSINGVQIPDTKIPISPVGNYNPRQIYNYGPNNNMPKKVNNHAFPITIQTNSVEIQPLVVRVSKPESLITQNIVVHTGQRLRDRIRQITTRENGYSESDVPMKRENNTFNNNPIKGYDRYIPANYPFHRVLPEPQPREDVIGFSMSDRGDSRLDTHYYEKINFGNNHNGKDEKQNINRYPYRPRFHEKLERVDTGSDGMLAYGVVTADKQVPGTDLQSRQQMSLIGMKKGASYDDTHFKNFLKTQEKVTDILERILATKPKANMARSVETA